MREGVIKVADDLSPTQRQFLEAACGVADRFNEYQVDEKPS